MDKNKLRTFIITYLYFKKKATSKQLAETYNEIGFENLGVTKAEVARFLKNEKNSNSKLNKLRLEKDKNRTIYYLDL